MHVIVNWGGRVNYDLRRIYNLTRMMRNSGYEVSIIERDSNRSRWLEEQFGDNVIHKADSNSIKKAVFLLPAP